MYRPPMTSRPRLALGMAPAIPGLLVAAGVTLAASKLSSQRIGLSSEPLSAGDELAAPASTRTPTPTPKPRRTATPKPTRTPSGSGGDDNGGSSGGSSSGGSGGSSGGSSSGGSSSS